MTTFVFDDSTTPRIHAFLIATGAYKSAQAAGSSIKLPPLPGVVPSATAFADFLVERSDKLFYPLGSIELLASDPTKAVTWRGKAVDEPTRANINSALKSWLGRLDSNEKSMALFYAGGHGCYKSGVHYFAEDAGDWDDPLAQTIRLAGFQTAMSTKRCALQWFIFDCCQDLPETVANQLAPTSGTTLLGTPGDQVREVGQLRIEAAAPGLQAYSGNKTHLMDALHIALNNNAAGPIPNGWGAKPNLLMEAMNEYGRAKYKSNWATCSIKSNADGLNCLHRLDGPPKVPVTIRTDPGKAFPEAAIKLIDMQSSKVALDVDGNKCDWPPNNAPNRKITLLGGFYRADAHFDAGTGFDDKQDMFQPIPPKLDVCLKIEESSTS